MFLPSLALVLVATSASPETCELKKPLKVFVAGAWKTIPVGATVTIHARGSTWTDVEAASIKGRAATPAFLALCPISQTPAEQAPPEQAPPEQAPTVASTPSVEPTAAPVAFDAPSAAVDTAPAPAVSVVPESPPETAPAVPSLPPPAPAPSVVLERLVAVAEVRADRQLESSARAVTTVLAAEIAAARGYRAVAPNELRALLSHQADASLLGCDSVNCLANVAKLADAELLATGTLESVDGALVLSLSLIEPSGPTVQARQEAVWRGSADDMLALVRPLVQRMLAGADGQAHQGALEVTAPAGALVVVDGREVGRAPLPAPLAAMPTGAHTVRVELDGHLPYQSDVVVAHNETTVARAILEEIPFTQRPWFWIAAGGAALVAGGAAAGITAWAVLSQEQSTSVVLAPKP
jgi:PEGA domain